MGLSKVITMVKQVLSFLAPQFKKDDSKYGVKELREAVKGVLVVAVFLMKRFKDGVQFTDFTAFYTALKEDAEFKATLEAAYNGYNQVPDEVKDIDAGETLEVVGEVLEHVDAIIETVKEDQPQIPVEVTTEAPVAEATPVEGLDTTPAEGESQS